MALTKNRAQIRANVRRFTDTGGTNDLARHPDADINEYIDRALGSAHRILTEVVPDTRILSSTVVTMSSGTSTYPLPGDFDSLISVDLLANGLKSWLTSYEMSERPMLTDPSSSFEGIPFCYRLRGANIEYLPVPGSSAYTSTLWYVTSAAQFSDDVTLYDTISRLDDYLVAYASRFVATKNKDMTLVSLCKSMIQEFRDDLQVAARERDKNSPSRITDENLADRFGRRARRHR